MKQANHKEKPGAYDAIHQSIVNPVVIMYVAVVPQVKEHG